MYQCPHCKTNFKEDSIKRLIDIFQSHIEGLPYEFNDRDREIAEDLRRLRTYAREHLRPPTNMLSSQNDIKESE